MLEFLKVLILEGHVQWNIKSVGWVCRDDVTIKIKVDQEKFEDFVWKNQSKFSYINKTKMN